MKFLFAGPTLYGDLPPGHSRGSTEILCRPPARQGDIARAVIDGASSIGLVDGRYEDVAAPWHKEILFAIDRGIRVFGAASMGALRAAECAPFGMVPVGAVARRYIRGELTDDAAVAQVHGPEELGSQPLSEALVNVEATIEAAVAARALSDREAGQLLSSARRIFFKDRTLSAIVEEAGCSHRDGERLIEILKLHWRDIKRQDAAALVARLRRAPGFRRTDKPVWSFHRTRAWQVFIEGLHHTLQERP